MLRTSITTLYIMLLVACLCDRDGLSPRDLRPHQYKVFRTSENCLFSRPPWDTLGSFSCYNSLVKQREIDSFSVSVWFEDQR